jgi:hypothetical protein
MAEDAARELPNLPLEDALQLVQLYAESRVAEVREGGDAVARAIPDRELARVLARTWTMADLGAGDRDYTGAGTTAAQPPLRSSLTAGQSSSGSGSTNICGCRATAG